MKIYFNIRFAKLYFTNYIQGRKFEELNIYFHLFVVTNYYFL